MVFPVQSNDEVASELENLDNINIRELLNHAGELLHLGFASNGVLSNLHTSTTFV